MIDISKYTMTTIIINPHHFHKMTSLRYVYCYVMIMGLWNKYDVDGHYSYSWRESL